MPETAIALGTLELHVGIYHNYTNPLVQRFDSKYKDVHSILSFSLSPLMPF